LRGRPALCLQFPARPGGESQEGGEQENDGGGGEERPPLTEDEREQEKEEDRREPGEECREPGEDGADFGGIGVHLDHAGHITRALDRGRETEQPAGQALDGDLLGAGRPFQPLPVAGHGGAQLLPEVVERLLLPRQPPGGFVVGIGGRLQPDALEADHADRLHFRVSCGKGSDGAADGLARVLGGLGLLQGRELVSDPHPHPLLDRRGSATSAIDHLGQGQKGHHRPALGPLAALPGPRCREQGCAEKSRDQRGDGQADQKPAAVGGGGFRHFF
jgi:hypothetical protein